MGNKFKILRGRYILTILMLYTILVTILSLIKLNDTLSVPSFQNMDKIAHFCFYFGMSFISAMLVSLRTPRKYRVLNFALIVILTSLYGFCIELIQEHVGRQYDVFDMVANSSGSVLGVGAYLFLEYLWLARKRRKGSL